MLDSDKIVRIKAEDLNDGDETMDEEDHEKQNKSGSPSKKLSLDNFTNKVLHVNGDLSFVTSSIKSLGGSSGYEDNKPEINSLKDKNNGKNIYGNRYADTSKRFGGFFHMFFQWKGSVFKLVWHDLAMFLVCYFTISLIYRFVLIDQELLKEYFEVICVFCSR